MQNMGMTALQDYAGQVMGGGAKGGLMMDLSSPYGQPAPNEPSIVDLLLMGLEGWDPGQHALSVAAGQGSPNMAQALSLPNLMNMLNSMSTKQASRERSNPVGNNPYIQSLMG